MPAVEVLADLAGETRALEGDEDEDDADEADAGETAAAIVAFCADAGEATEASVRGGGCGGDKLPSPAIERRREPAAFLVESFAPAFVDKEEED